MEKPFLRQKINGGSWHCSQLLQWISHSTLLRFEPLKMDFSNGIKFSPECFSSSQSITVSLLSRRPTTQLYCSNMLQFYTECLAQFKSSLTLRNLTKSHVCFAGYHCRLGAVAHTFSHRNQEAQAGRSLNTNAFRSQLLHQCLKCTQSTLY